MTIKEPDGGWKPEFLERRRGPDLRKTDPEFIALLKKLCAEYDRELGEWPENKHEGLAFFEWVTK